MLILSAIGLAALHSATRVLPRGYNGDKMFLMQVICLAIGIVLAIITSMIDYKDFRTLGIIPVSYTHLSKIHKRIVLLLDTNCLVI